MGVAYVSYKPFLPRLPCFVYALILYVPLFGPLRDLHYRVWIPLISFLSGWGGYAPPCSDANSIAAWSRNNTGLKVIAPSVGQTGTTSVILALRMMGMRAYHIEEKTLFAKPITRDQPQPAFLAEQISKCRITAISLEPTTDLLWALLQVSPDAKVILSWRDYQSWWVSTTTGGLKKDQRWAGIRSVFWSSCVMFPWPAIFDAGTGVISRVMMAGDPFAGIGQLTWPSYLALLTLGSYANPGDNMYSRGVFKIGGLEDAYLAHLNEIRTSVPPERLLEFDVRKHGFDEVL